MQDCSDQSYILSPRPFWALAGVKGHLLPFLKFVIGDALQSRAVKEQIFARSSIDEAKAFVR